MNLERRHVRLPAEYRVYLETGAGDEKEKIRVCRTMDVSASGIRLKLGQELTLGAFIHLGVETSREAAPLILVAVVRWCQPIEAEGEPGQALWSAGLELQPASDSDLNVWFDLLAGLEQAG